jgi:hypothetical protein
MTKQYARTYIHLETAGNPTACDSVYKDAHGVVKDLYDKGQVAGFRLFVVNDEDDAEDLLISFVCDHEALTKGRYPFVFCQLQPLAEGDPTDLDAFMNDMNFTLCR